MFSAFSVVLRSKIDQMFCACGCGRRTQLARANDATRGYSKGQPKRLVVGHSRRGQAPKTIEEAVARLMPRLVQQGDCLVQTVGLDNRGYGFVMVGLRPAKRLKASRAVFTILNGPIPAGM